MKYTCGVLKKMPTSEIIFERNYENNEMCELTDAIIEHICCLDSVKYLSRRDRFIFECKDEFEIGEGICGKFIEGNQTKSLTFKIYSYTKPLSFLRNWCDRIHQNYNETNQSKFLKYRCYFNQICNSKMPSLTFTHTKFETTKSLKNLFGKHIDEIKQRLDMFLHNKQWYIDKGVPYSLGMLLYGKPGCGKTSLIKSIANDAKRHIINIQITDKTTVDELHNLFYNPKISIYQNNTFTSITVPLDERLYVLEDVDCSTNIVAKRGEEKNDLNEPEFNKDVFNRFEESMNPKISLSHFLNVLDGILEIDGRMIIMTTNFPDKIDDALKRPGRFDCCIEFGKCDTNTLIKMIEHFFDVKIDDIKEYDKFDDVFTPAEVQEILLKNMYSNKKIIECLNEFLLST